MSLLDKRKRMNTKEKQCQTLRNNIIRVLRATLDDSGVLFEPTELPSSYRSQILSYETNHYLFIIQIY